MKSSPKNLLKRRKRRKPSPNFALKLETFPKMKPKRMILSGIDLRRVEKPPRRKRERGGARNGYTTI